MNEAIYIFGGVFVLVVVFYFLNLRRSGTQHGTFPRRSGDQPLSRNQESDSKPGPARSQIEDLPGGAKMEAPNKRLGDQPSSRNQESDSKPGPTRSQIEDLPGGAKMEFVHIPAGTFLMGSPDSEINQLNDLDNTDIYICEGPQHQVTISKGFYLGKVVVTHRQWAAVMGTTPWAGVTGALAGSKQPAVNVSWDDAQEYVEKLNAAAGRPLYRLPTEAEWEYACRAGTTTGWSFGDDERQLGEYAWYYDNVCAIWKYKDIWAPEKESARSVGRKLPNAWGLFDMHGNVWEWVQDWWGGYTDSAKVDPQGPSTGSYRVVRGGDFYSFSRYFASLMQDEGSYHVYHRGVDFYNVAQNTQNTRSASRGYDSPSSRGISIGFRLLRIE